MAVHARPVLQRHGAPLHVEVSRGLGDTPVSPKGVAEGGVPDRATLKPTSGAMVAALRWSSRALPLCGSAYPARPSKP
jgi:hypothetical protein